MITGPKTINSLVPTQGQRGQQGKQSQVRDEENLIPSATLASLVQAEPQTSQICELANSLFHSSRLGYPSWTRILNRSPVFWTFIVRGPSASSVLLALVVAKGGPLVQTSHAPSLLSIYPVSFLSNQPNSGTSPTHAQATQP